MANVRNLLEGKPVFSIQQGFSVFEAVKFMAEKKVGAVPVLNGTQLMGIFSERDVITRVVAKELDPKTILVESVMTKNIVVANADENFDDCLRKMKAANCRHLPVVSGDRLLGIVSLRDILQNEISDKEQMLEYLNSYLFHVPPEAK